VVAGGDDLSSVALVTIASSSPATSSPEMGGAMTSFFGDAGTDLLVSGLGLTP